MIEIRAADPWACSTASPSALFALDLDVVAARVSTSGHEVVDAFYVA